MQNECGCQQPVTCGKGDCGRGVHAFIFVLFILLIIIAFQGC